MLRVAIMVPVVCDTGARYLMFNHICRSESRRRGFCELRNSIRLFWGRLPETARQIRQRRLQGIQSDELCPCLDQSSAWISWSLQRDEDFDNGTGLYVETEREPALNNHAGQAGIIICKVKDLVEGEMIGERKALKSVTTLAFSVSMPSDASVLD